MMLPKRRMASVTISIALAILSLSRSIASATTVACDSNALPADSTKASRVTPNTFHKICPSSSSLGPPMCGDGTPFSFYYSSPVQRRSSNKILVEFLGGGACWDADTCGYNADRLTFPTALDDYVGLSCSEIQAGLDQQQQQGGGDNDNNGENQNQNVPINMLCAQTLGDDLDLRAYHTLIVPYCTQDTHHGSNTVTYQDGSTVHHYGGHNTMAVLEWMYDNFPHPDHVVLTGCSAGATVLPVAYDLVHHHYNSWTKGKTQTAVSTLMDSPVYLTPSYFLENGLPLWNVEPMMKKLRFNSAKYSQSEDYSTRVLEHVLKRGSNRDQWGLITHTSDPVSLAYYQRMSKSYNDDDDDNGRFLEDNGEASEDEWWSELSTSLQGVTSKHSNIESYIIDGEGHCSFGLYYALTEGGQDFADWAGNLLHLRKTQAPSGRGWFWFSALIGCGLIGASVYHQRRQLTVASGSKENVDEDSSVSPSQVNATVGRIKGFLQRASAFVARFTQDTPVTIAYGTALTIYFLRVMTWDGLERILYNPSIGPSASTLSSFGINNPTLVVYHSQILRVLASSSLLCSGIITYAMVMFSLYKYIGPLEETMRSLSAESGGRATMSFSSRSFLEVTVMISIGSNIVYAILANGASCSSMAVVLGLQAFSCAMHRYHRQSDFPRTMWATIAMFLVTCLFLPFNSWIMMTTAIFLGIGMALWVYPPQTTHVMQDPIHVSRSDYKPYLEVEDEQPKALSTNSSSKTIVVGHNRLLQGLLGVFGLLFFLLVARLRRPDRTYEQPFMTGCELVYTTHVSDIVNSYAGDQFGGNNNDNNRFRRQRGLEEEDNADGDDEESDEEFMCAQFCVPHLLSRPFLWGANIYTGFGVQRGWCEDVGYGQHIADKTFSYKSYSIDIELYFDDSYNANNNGEGR